MLFATDPNDRIIDRIADFEDSMKRNDRFIRPVDFLNGEIRFTEVLDARSSDDFHVAWCAPVPICYHVVLRLLIDIPTKSVENILERMNHGFFISCVCD